MADKKPSSPILGKLDLSRRHILAGGAAVVMVPTFWKQASAQDRRIVIRDPGGPYMPAFKEAFYDPFKAATGIEAIGIQGQHEPTSLIKGMVDTKTYTWDMAHLSLAACLQSAAGGYLEKLNVTSPGIEATPAEYKNDYFMGVNVFSTILAYRTDAFEGKGKAPPQSWADYFNVEKFPGRRAMRKHPFDTIEEALLGDGVPLDKVYPLDFDRAYKKLSAFRNNVSVWWTGGAQTSQLLKSGEVDICPSWNARVQAAIDDGAPVKIVWNQQIWSPEGWTILKGSPKADLCREFIKFATDAKRQAVFTKQLGYGPTLPAAYNDIPPERAKILPTAPENIKSRLRFDVDYWAKVKDKEIERFNAWILS